MNGNYLLDTNIIISLFDNDKSVIENIKGKSVIYVPSIVIGELFYGAYNSNKQKDNIKKISQFQKDVIILDCDSITGNHYGRIMKELKTKGCPVPENDIWISAIAHQYDLVLISRDKHFEKIDNLKLTKW